MRIAGAVAVVLGTLISASTGSSLAAQYGCSNPNTYRITKCGTESEWNPILTLQIATDLVSEPQFNFPPATVQLCYNQTNLNMKFVASGEPSYYVNSTLGHNDNIWAYTVMETFLQTGTDDPSNYLEFEVAPNGVTYSSFVYNPSLVRAAGAPFGHFFVPVYDNGNQGAFIGISANTNTNPAAKTWSSQVSFPLSLFNVNSPEGTFWRMNFFRTVMVQDNTQNWVQHYGAWNAPNVVSFHIVPCFGRFLFDW
ncbi:uncharacterized protein BJ171DRAFT_422936 [Polychytrium aggregatum]|uniref:uncharacterized protein n=1 Tax=Polychytrium aggregatum TaxID=110093 RepID=UPI0022FECAB2|nr:uncharacterized protein BJ171DRAFT_422936 [Polychytrium aggregatum]KAI9205636.1 hypothetical protein BJ171DRAFT_422936 [Polychytrium aggregatum]